MHPTRNHDSMSAALSASRTLATVTLLAALACAPPPRVTENPMTITICGQVDRIEERTEADGIATRITVRDARSGERFVFLIRPANRGAFQDALGAPPSEAYRGASLCASGYPRSGADTRLFELDSPADITVNRPAK